MDKETKRFEREHKKKERKKEREHKIKEREEKRDRGRNKSKGRRRQPNRERKQRSRVMPNAQNVRMHMARVRPCGFIVTCATHGSMLNVLDFQEMKFLISTFALIVSRST